MESDERGCRSVRRCFWEPVTICDHAIKRGELDIEQHALTAQDEDRAGDVDRYGGSAGSLWHPHWFSRLAERLALLPGALASW